MHPPKHVRPHRNVNIMLCDIDCDREVPLTENASGREFMRALEGWSAISDNIFVWDYGINFDNMVAPFPNFHILQPNIRQFLDHHATMHFSQIGGSKGGDFSEMRAYVVSKLMWNPQQRVDSLMRSFTDGYYGAAGPSSTTMSGRSRGRCSPADSGCGSTIRRCRTRTACSMRRAASATTSSSTLPSVP